jgi:hypothetical protein
MAYHFAHRPRLAGHHASFSGNNSRRRGLGLVEVLLCLSISSMLLTAVALAFRASFNSFKDSQQRGQIINSARGGLYQITADIRAADSIAPYDPTASVTTSENTQFASQIVPGNPTGGLPSAGGSGVLGIQILKTHSDSRDPTASIANPIIITYWLNTSSQTVYMTRKAGSATPTPYPIATLVQSLQIYLQPLLEPPNPQTKTSAMVVCRRAVVTMTLANKDADGNRILPEAGQNVVMTFTDSAVPRRTFPGI